MDAKRGGGDLWAQHENITTRGRAFMGEGNPAQKHHVHRTASGSVSADAQSLGRVPPSSYPNQHQCRFIHVVLVCCSFLIHDDASAETFAGLLAPHRAIAGRLDGQRRATTLLQ